MGRALSHFLRRNIAGEQSLKPVVRSYYAHVAEPALGTVHRSDAVIKSESGDRTEEWLRPATTSPAEHKESVQRPASEQDVKPDTRVYSSTPDKKERHDALTPAEGKETADNNLMGTQSSLKASGTQTQRPLANREMPEPTQNTAPPPFEPHSPPDKMNTHAKFWRGKATPVRTMAGESVVTPTPSAKRRDFTQQVAASILGNESAYQDGQTLVAPSPVGADLSTDTLSMREEQLDVKVSIHHISIVPAANTLETKNAGWKPPVSLTDYLRERREGNR